jgi:hypothetical protein
MDYETAWTYCCSIGMKPIEFPYGKYPEMLEKLVAGLFSFYVFCAVISLLILLPGNRALVPAISRIMYMGETEAFNGTHERWCQSKELVSASPVFI